MSVSARSKRATDDAEEALEKAVGKPPDDVPLRNTDEDAGEGQPAHRFDPVVDVVCRLEEAGDREPEGFLDLGVRYHRRRIDHVIHVRRDDEARRAPAALSLRIVQAAQIARVCQ